MSVLRLLFFTKPNNGSVIRSSLPQAGNVTGTQLSASSPDEEAFVNAAESFGYKFVNRSKDVVTLNVSVGSRGAQEYRVVCMLPYTQVSSAGYGSPSVTWRPVHARALLQ